MFLSEIDLNKMGQDIVLAYNQDIYAPVDIEGLLKKMLNISVEDYTLHPSGLILGMCSNKSQLVKVKKGNEILLAELNRNVVFIDSSLTAPQYEGRRNFTIAHEGSHHFLFNLEKRTSGYERSFYRKIMQARIFDPEEWKADILASCLLLPEQNVRCAFYKFFQKDHVDTISPFDYLNFNHLTEMALFFHVSKTALAIRLKKLGLINDFYFKRSIDIIKTE